jgi:hypothetical protein
MDAALHTVAKALRKVAINEAFRRITLACEAFAENKNSELHETVAMLLMIVSSLEYRLPEDVVKKLHKELKICRQAQWQKTRAEDKLKKEREVAEEPPDDESGTTEDEGENEEDGEDDNEDEEMADDWELRVETDSDPEDIVPAVSR